MWKRIWWPTDSQLEKGSRTKGIRFMEFSVLRRLCFAICILGNAMVDDQNTDDSWHPICGDFCGVIVFLPVGYLSNSSCSDSCGLFSLLHALFDIHSLIFVSPSFYPMQCRRIYLVIQALRVFRLPVSLRSYKFQNLLFLFINCDLGMFLISNYTSDILFYNGIHKGLRVVYALLGLYLLFYLASWMRST